ncbi:lipoate--protein ligase family protein [bacterium]|nr:lipoate--protein ligase family protein [bacterium]
MKFEILQEPAGSGAYQMQRDWELLESAAKGGKVGVVRFYKWDKPTISLGYHQKESMLLLDEMEADAVPWVRRPTGGAAVLHSEELTYAVACPKAERQQTASLVLEYVGRAITEGLRAIGVDAQLEPRGEPLSALPNRTMCFVRTSRWEVTANGRKIVGSAQRKYEGAILQHGSILIGSDHLRIAEYLRLKSEHDRTILREKLNARSTSVEQETGQVIPDAEIREQMERSFRAVFGELTERLTALGALKL